MQADLRSHLESKFGPAQSPGYWAHYEELRDELGYADYLGAVQRFRLGKESDSGTVRW